MLLARHLQGLELPLSFLGRASPVDDEVQHSAALVQSPQETLRSLTRPDVEVKFSSTMAKRYSIKGEGQNVVGCDRLYLGWWEGG